MYIQDVPAQIHVCSFSHDDFTFFHSAKLWHVTVNVCPETMNHIEVFFLYLILAFGIVVFSCARTRSRTRPLYNRTLPLLVLIVRTHNSMTHMFSISKIGLGLDRIHTTPAMKVQSAFLEYILFTDKWNYSGPYVSKKSKAASHATRFSLTCFKRLIFKRT